MKKIYLALILFVYLGGCSSTYYSTLEKFGVHKRDLLVDRVGDARDAQVQAKGQFESALDQFGSVVNFDGGDLQATYNKMDAEYQASVASAKDVSNRIDSVESVSKALFKEWEQELARYSNPSLQAKSQSQLYRTRTQYKGLIASMRVAQKKMQPVLEVFEDQVLFLKHNLNAKAVMTLKSEYKSISTDVAKLVRDMQKSINQANDFIASLE